MTIDSNEKSTDIPQELKEEIMRWPNFIDITTHIQTSNFLQALHEFLIMTYLSSLTTSLQHHYSQSYSADAIVCIREIS
ncbi:hypothetical protein EYC80_005079 [Monilinia laxa]|uniref:Uncharacterized protein n=1 Tax=Monilinia laxa TaxID=61186 RepID=A0A5N6KJ11_MONLA|nr:hypothetical protein EYC80_005079 [Monilinia laxa]